jgi:hypothetical protein
VRALFGALLCATSTLFAQTQPALLSANQPVSFDLGAGSYTSGIAFDIPAGTTRFKVELSSTANANTDLFIRAGDSFPSKNSLNQSLAADELLDYAQHFAISTAGSESILVSDANIRKPTATRYFVNVLNNAAATTRATLRLTLNPAVTPTPIQVRFDLGCAPGQANCDCDIAPWNDPSTTGFVSPGNTGTTLGQKRRNALLAAVNQISTTLQNEQITVIRACFEDLGVSGDGATLAQAGTNAIWANTINVNSLNPNNSIYYEPTYRFLPTAHTWYSGAVTNRYGGAAGCATVGADCATYSDMTVTFNTAIDTQGFSGSKFYYGTNPIPAGNDNFEFVTIALHEILHGLGYAELVDEEGREALGLDDAFSQNLTWDNQGTRFIYSRLSDAERKAAQTSNSVFWSGAAGIASAGSAVLGVEPGIKMHAPTEFSPGSSISHLDLNRFGNQLMAPSYSAGLRSLGFAAGQLQDVGWRNPAPIAAKPRIYAGNWFDVQRNGHGIDIHPIPSASGSSFDRAFVKFYTHDQAGNPEYYIGFGPIVDSQMLADSNTAANGNSTSLGRYLVRNGVISSDPNYTGKLRLDLLDGSNSAPCTRSGRNPISGPSMSALFVVNQDISNWCLEPIGTPAQRPANDFSGIWYNEADGGWGVSLLNLNQNGGNFLNVLIYYPDAQGNPRWAYAFATNFSSGQTLQVFNRIGYCRGCPVREPVDQLIGTITLSLGQVEGTTGGNNQVTLDLTYPGAEGGRFNRTDAKLVRLTNRPRFLQ